MTAPHRMLADTVHSVAMQNVFKTIERVASSDLGIMIVGEFGTGKEWLARRIHQLSLRSGKKFQAVDCSVLPPETREQELFGQELLIDSTFIALKGFLELANGGTLMLGSLESLPRELQTKIAKSVEHQKFHRFGGNKEIWFNARTILTTANRPDPSTAEGLFQKDIFCRLAPVVIELPPLRERKPDILPLIKRFITHSNERNATKVTGISLDALEVCYSYLWPGNIRELRNTIEYAVIMAQEHLIQVTHLPVQVRGKNLSQNPEIVVEKSLSVSDIEKLLIEQALDHTSSKKEAARMLGISVKTLYNKLSRYRLENKAEETAQGKSETGSPSSDHADDQQRTRSVNSA